MTSEQIDAHADALITSFVQPDRRARLAGLRGSVSARRKFAIEVALRQPFRTDRRVPVVSGTGPVPEAVLRQLEALGAAADTPCVVFTVDGDAFVQDLRSALDDHAGLAAGVVVSIAPGALVYTESEWGDRFVLQGP
jgi:hypothetical protein